MKSHCHPASPSQPSIVSSSPDSGPPMTDEIGIATMNQAMMRVRYSRGNHVDEVEGDAREEAGLGGAQQQPKQVEAVGPDGEGHRRRRQAPA